jgi:hypothetical protein
MLHHIVMFRLASDSAPCPQNFRYRPGLCDASPRGEGRVTIENLTERAQAVRMNLFAERLEKTQGRSAIGVDT